MALTEDDKHWINSQLEREVERIEARIERVETNLLTAFHPWASPMEMRQRTHSAAIRALDEEVENLQDRVKKPET